MAGRENRVASCRVVQAQLYRRRGARGGKAWRIATYGMLALDGGAWGVAAFYLRLGGASVATRERASPASGALGAMARKRQYSFAAFANEPAVSYARAS